MAEWTKHCIVMLDVGLNPKYTLLYIISVHNAPHIRWRLISTQSCTTWEQHLRWPFLRCRRPAHMERAAVQATRHRTIADYFERTSENVLILRRVLRVRPRHICNIYDLFAPCINLLTYLLMRTGTQSWVCIGLVNNVVIALRSVRAHCYVIHTSWVLERDWLASIWRKASLV